ncbi:MAG: hypothetical protein IJ603_05715 [Bacteroidales bacterium]|nr:hypothetical protein [Bacteroidales bacterium]
MDQRLMWFEYKDSEKKGVKKVPKKFAGSKKVSTFASPFGNGGMKKALSHRLNAEFFKIFAEKFADSRKVTTFATPFGNGGMKKLFHIV